ncbi:MAG: amino acid racemase [Candidatus Paceibacterota bacterium]|jgi:aspartate racemase
MKTLGILGGVGPQTTSKIYHKIIDSFREKGRKYPSIMIYNLPFPFKVEYEAIIEGQNSHKMLPYLLSGAKILEKSGASFGILPCNTLHKYISEIRKSVKIPFLSILEEVKRDLNTRKINKICILATQSTVNDRLYDNLLDKSKIIYPSKNDQRSLDKIILRLINGQSSKNDTEQFQKICQNASDVGAEAILLACTDLQEIAIKITPKAPFIDTVEILVNSSLQMLRQK